MTLQQLKYVIEIAKYGSMRQAADALFITQPNLTKSIKELENEMGITIFSRTSKGVIVTDEGKTFLSYAKMVIEQSDLLESKYKNTENIKRIFSVSAQHYSFVVNAFVKLVEEIGKNEYEFSLRECKTYEIIDDVKNNRSEIGVIYLSKFNTDVMKKVIEKNNLKFELLFKAEPHVFISKNNPLAQKKIVTLSDLKGYPRLTFDQGENNSFYYSEEPHSIEPASKSIVVSDRATLFNLVIGLNGYTISSGVLSSDLNGEDIIAVPLKSDEEMRIGYIYNPEIPLNDISIRYIEILKEYIEENK